jgi:hypothetical protein
MGPNLRVGSPVGVQMLVLGGIAKCGASEEPLERDIPEARLGVVYIPGRRKTAR